MRKLELHDGQEVTGMGVVEVDSRLLVAAFREADDAQAFIDAERWKLWARGLACAVIRYVQGSGEIRFYDGTKVLYWTENIDPSGLPVLSDEQWSEIAEKVK